MLLGTTFNCIEVNPKFATPSTDYHLVKKGETLSSIARQHRISVENLKLYNNLDSEKLKPGQKLYFKPQNEHKNEFITVQDVPDSKYHEVKKGDSLYRIAKMYNLEVIDLLDYNGLSSFDIVPGQKIWLEDGHVGQKREKPVEEQAEPTSYYKVKKGDTLYRIAKRYKLTLEEIKIINGLTSGKVKVGQLLKVVKDEPRLESPVTNVETEVNYTISQDLTPYLPLRGKFLSGFGKRGRKQHKGVDIGAATGEPIYAALPGKVVFSGRQRGYGNVIILEHGNNIMTVYGHNESNLVQLADSVAKGQPIATVGRSGNATTPHLHLEYRVNGKAVDPVRVFPEIVPVKKEEEIQTQSGDE